MTQDLASSNLEIDDVYARPLDIPERTACGVPPNVDGYVLPYHNLAGRPVAFYRVRLFDFDPKYKQPKDHATHVYFPPNFLSVANASPYILITEGEKKACLATKLGFPCVGLGGVDNWRNRSLVLPNVLNISKPTHGGKQTVKIPSDTEVHEDDTASLASGLQDLIDYVLRHQKQVIIIFDSDNDTTNNTTNSTASVKSSVQRAAATLGFELRFRGIPFSHIRQVILPPPHVQITKRHSDKTGLDDFLLPHEGPAQLKTLIEDCLKKRSAFPRHPTLRDFINRRLQRVKLSRKELVGLSMAILSELDVDGIRLRNSETLDNYYFDIRSRKLIRAQFDYLRGLPDTVFGRHIYERFGLSAADAKLWEWLGAQFTGEQPIEEVSPHRVIARHDPLDDNVKYQISDAQFIRIDKTGVALFDNGEDGIMFESTGHPPVDRELFLAEFGRQSQPNAPLVFQWDEVLKDVRLKDQNQTRTATALLYYMSPWLYKWRGMQLPIELIIGESGSGKSTLCELRLNILTGEVNLRNAPGELKDWHASISSVGGLHVTDNVQLIDRSMRNRLSDDICRIITEPNPHIEMRKFYTEAQLMRIPVRAVFAMTAIQQPFQNVDLLQRAFIVDFEKKSPLNNPNIPITYDSQWRYNQLNRYGGRESWLAHHCVVLQRFFQLIAREWNPNYMARNRLIHFEQAMLMMGKIFGIETDWIPPFLTSVTNNAVQEADWILSGLRVFADEKMHKYTQLDPKTKQPHSFVANDIVEWACGHEEFHNCEGMTSPRRLGRYLQSHKSMIAQITGITEAGSTQNRQRYRLIRPKEIT